MNVLLTGSSGHIGSAVAHGLSRSARVIGLDRRSGARTTHLIDLTDYQRVRELVRGMDVVVHTAALHVPDLGTADEALFQRVNVDATRNLLDAAARFGVTRFVFLSTTSVYGCSSRWGPPAAWADESLQPQPEDVYDRTKLEAEALCHEAAGPTMSTVVLRLARCFPEPAHLVAFYRLYRGVDRRDVVEAHCLAASVPLAGSTTVNIAGPTTFLPEDVHRLWDDPWRVIERRCPGLAAGFGSRGWPRPSRIDRVYPAAKARAVLGYEPRHGVMELLDQVDGVMTTASGRSGEPS